MKKLITVLLALFCLSAVLVAQTSNPTILEIEKIADRTANELWGNVFSDDPIPYYFKNDELIGYRFNYSINKPFPVKESLIKSCKEAFEIGDFKTQWGIEKFGNIFISARKDLPVINDYSQALSPKYSMGFKLEEIAQSNIGTDAILQKVYYINFENQWFCYGNGLEEVYICLFPKIQFVNKIQFDEIVEPLGFFCSKGDFTEEWDQYSKGNIKPGKAEIWIPYHDGNCKFYDWSYGCSPTAAAMLLSYWDYNSINTTDNYSKLIKYHFQRWDGIEGMEWDYQVPNVQKELAIAMGTDTVSSGGTDRTDIAPGYAYVCNNIHGYNFNCSHHDEGSDYVWYFTKIFDEINLGRPIHISIPDHSECCVALDPVTCLIGVHNTWWGAVQWINRNQLERVYTIIPANPHGLAIHLLHPVGDTSYNGNGGDPGLESGDFCEISWDYDYAANSIVMLFYSIDGGYNWNQITSNTPNDGIYDWFIPSGINSMSCRIHIEVYESGAFSGADGSFGNVRIFSGGSLDYLNSGVQELCLWEPDYYLFNHGYTTWCAVGVKSETAGEDWDIRMYDDNSFSNQIAVSSNGASKPVDFIVMDGHHTPALDRGIKINRLTGSGYGTLEFEGGTETFSLGSNFFTWTPGRIIEMFDVYLTPGVYEFKLEETYSISDFDVALFGSTGEPYYASRNAYMAGSFNTGSGVDEMFTCTINASDHYGLCVWLKNDYPGNFYIKIEKAGTWTGAADTDWHNPDNWTGNVVPDATIDVIIPETTNKCWIFAADAECKNLNIYYGTGANFLKVFDEDLHVYGDLIINGQLILDHPAGKLIVDGNVSWESGSTAYFPSYDEFLVYGDWHFKNGANAQINNGTVEFVGTGGNYIYSDDADCYFNNITCNKTGGGWLSISNSSSQYLNIHGDINIQPNSYLYSFTPGSVILQGDLINSGMFECYNGTFVFDGDEQVISENLSYTTTTNFNKLTISSANHTSIWYKDINVNNHVTIESGYIATNQTIHVGGNWDNQTGSPGISGNTTVEFNGGNYYQSCSNETFYTLEMNNSMGGALLISGTDVICSNYKWTAGLIDVESGGSFTANDLLDNGIFGAYVISSGGTVNLSNYDGQVHLNGDLYIGDGTMNIYGGLSYSYWPSTANASITMTDGILDFHDRGIYIHDAAPYHLTEDITGGTIRTAGCFRSETNEFTPDFGTMEFYGDTYNLIHTHNGSYLNNVVINKSNDTILLLGVTDIHGNLTINSGVLNSDGWPIYIGGDWTNNVGDSGFIESTGSVFFNGNSNATIFSNETFYNVFLDKIISGVNMLNLSPGITINTNNLTPLYGNLIFNNNSQVNVEGDMNIEWGFLTLDHNSSINVAGDVTIEDGLIDASQGTNIGITVGGNWTDNNIQGGFYSGGETIIFNGNSDQIFSAAYFEGMYFNNLTINKTGGYFRPDNILVVFGDLNITAGDWWDNSAGLTHHFCGNFTIESSGNFYPEGTTVFAGASDQYYQNNGGSGFFKGIMVNKSTKGVQGKVPKNMTLILNSDMVVYMDNTTVIEEGTLDLNGHLYKATGNVEIHDGGSLIVDAGASLSLHSHLFVNSGGTLTTAGVSGNNALIYTDGSGDYSIEILGGTISAGHTTFEDLEPTGLWVHDGAFIDQANSFNNCSFDGYTNPGGSTWLIIDNDQVLTIDNISFPNNPGGPLATNIGKNMDHGHITLTNASGAFSGPMFEYDPHDRIDWDAQGIISDFEGGDTDGWHSGGDGNSYWEAGTGNPGGCMRVDDDASGDRNLAYAPIKFLGDWSSATTSDYISTDIFLHRIWGGYASNNFVFRIVGPGGSAKAIYDPAPTPPFDTWITYSVNLNETDWMILSGTWSALLENITTFIVNVEYINGDEYDRMDNVCLSFTPTVVPLLPVICSDFESGLFEGWSFISAGSVSIPESGGNPGRYLQVNDASGISLAVPPSTYHGSWSLLDSHNAEIHIDYKITNIDGPLLTPGFLIKLSGPGGVATYPWDSSMELAFNKWHSFGIPIEQTGWTIESGSWVALLNYITDIRIAAEFISGNETVCIDNFCISNLPPVTDFSADRTIIFPGETVNFHDQTTSAPSTWDWDFGDSGSSTEVNPVHQYNTPGFYNIELTTTNYFGSDTEIKTNYIEVYPIDQCLKFEDDFNDNTIHPVWWIKNGTWSEASGNIRQTSNYWVSGSLLYGCYAIAGSPFWENYILSCDLYSTDNDKIGFVWNWQDEQNMYMFCWDRQGGARKLYRWVDGVATALAEDNIVYSMSTWYHIDIYSIDGKQVIAIDGVEVLNAVDNTFTTGKAGLYCYGNQSSYWDNFKVECPGAPVDLKVFLEGPFTGGEMNTGLNDNNFLVTDNPYTGAPWNHSGNEGVLSFLNPDVVDWIYVDFRDATSASTALSGTSVGTKAALLLKNGLVISPYGELPLYLNSTINNNLFIVVRHRNHLGIISANAVTETGGVYTYNFTTGVDQAYGGLLGHKEIGTGVWGMIG
ncbi:MAG: PKD domain-containing protein, partial [Bacteroidales bacterium]|nr:PKD domain-containing protein [Bacteroidales bacterium]